jgi:hypothetical protein
MFQLSILLTEDSGKQGYPTLHALVREMLRLVDPQARLTIKRVDFEPLQKEQARLAQRANAWDSSDPKGKDVDRFEEWEANRPLLDELEKPKVEVCLRDMHNLELAQESFPAEHVFEVGKSFTEAVETLRSCPALAQALSSTHASG